MREIDLVVVKGKTQPVRVYEVLDYHTAETFPNLLDVVNYFNEGIEALPGCELGEGVGPFRQVPRISSGRRAVGDVYRPLPRSSRRTRRPATWNGVLGHDGEVTSQRCKVAEPGLVPISRAPLSVPVSSRGCAPRTPCSDCRRRRDVQGAARYPRIPG